MHLLARVIRGHEVLGAILDPLDGALEALRREGDEDVLGVELAAHAEAAADVDLDEPDRVLLETEQRGDRAAVEVLHLGGAPEREHARGRVVVGDEPARLHRHARVALHREAPGDAHVGAGGGGLDIAEARRDRVDDVRRDVVVHRALAGRGGGEIGGDGQRVEVELHELGGVLRRPRILGDDERDRLADVAHDVACEQRLQHAFGLGRGREHEPDRDADVGHVGRVEDRDDARKRAGGPGIDAAQTGVRHGAAHEAGVQLARERSRPRRSARGR